MSCTLYVANLQPWVTSAHLARKFRCYGIVESDEVVIEKSDNESASGYVEMATPKYAQLAADALDASLFDGRVISVRAVTSVQAVRATG
jgi:RNA recognition motif-containing protein